MKGEWSDCEDTGDSPGIRREFVALAIAVPLLFGFALGSWLI